jgi:hypothetical protein
MKIGEIAYRKTQEKAGGTDQASASPHGGAANDTDPPKDDIIDADFTEKK